LENHFLEENANVIDMQNKVEQEHKELGLCAI
jgi:hypothetical protein